MKLHELKVKVHVVYVTALAVVSVLVTVKLVVADKKVKKHVQVVA